MADGNYQINGGKPLRFPIDHSTFHRSKVKFQAIKVDPPGLNIRLAADGSKVVSRSLDKSQEQGFRKLQYDPIDGEIANIHLPMNFAVNDNFEYSGAEFKNSLTIAGAAAFEAGNSSIEAAKKAISDTTGSFVNFFRGQTGLTSTAANLSALRTGELFSAIGFSGVANTLSVIGKVALHPNIRNRFTGVSLRSFSFAFKFLPKSQRESDEIKKIVKFFRFHAYPHQIPPDTSFGVGYEYPSLFKIQLLSGAPEGSSYYNVGTPIKFSYLRSISTSYNPTTPVLHDDGAPTEVDLSLTFTEHKTLHRGDIIKEDDQSFYEAGGALKGSNINGQQTNTAVNSKPTPYKGPSGEGMSVENLP